MIYLAKISRPIEQILVLNWPVGLNLERKVTENE